MKKFNMPKHYNASNKDQVYRIDYARLAEDAMTYKATESITNAATDKLKIGVMPIDMQNTFCIPGFELFVQDSPDDSARLAEFIYQNIGRITKIIPTMDTHGAMQIFHSIFFINSKGEHAPAMTMISSNDLKTGVWKVNPAIASNYGISYTYLCKYALHYCEELEKKGKYLLTIWPYHAMLGGIGHALVSIVEEACFFHAQVRNTQYNIEVKGNNPRTENYSVLSPEVLTDPNGNAVAQKNTKLIDSLLKLDMLIIPGQAKSHCLAWTIQDLLDTIVSVDPTLAKKVYLLEDCTSPVVIPGVVDFTDQANDAFDKFRAAGMNVVKSTDPIHTWPNVDLNKLV